MAGAKETFYDERISPLMSQIIALCKEQGINMAAQFSLGYDRDADATMFCTTVLHDVDPSDAKGVERMCALRRVMYPPSQLLAITVIGGK